MSTQVFAEEKAVSFNVIQPEKTHTGGVIKPLPRGLPKTTESLCTECLKIIPAIIR